MVGSSLADTSLAGSSMAAAAAVSACGECGAPASGNFCSGCGADLRISSLSFLGQAAAPVRRSFPAVYLKILRAPVRQTVAFAEDPAYRGYLSFALAGIAIYCLFFVPIAVRMAAPVDANAHMSESMQSLMKVLSQTGVYVGMAIAFVLAYGMFRVFSPARRSFTAYFKLYAIAIGFVAPIYGVYEFGVRALFDGVGMSALYMVTADGWQRPTVIASIVLSLVLWAYFIAIHRRFWSMSIWAATGLYLLASLISNQVGYHLMWWVGFYAARVLINAGIVTL